MRLLSNTLLLLLRPLLLIGLLIGPGTTAFAEHQNDPTAELIQRLSNIRSLSGQFTQQTVGADNRTLQTSTGILWVDQKSRFRIETSEPFEQTLISDGQSFWNYDADLQQVTISPMDQDFRDVPVLLLGGQYDSIASEYRVQSFDDEEATHFVLEPLASDSLFRSLAFEFIDEKPIAIAINDTLGQRTRINLGQTTLNEDMDAARFSFVPPDDVDIIDDR